MFFEGSEKKFELVCGPDACLLAKGDDFWTHLVSRARASILSKISNSEMIAYLLSESSLFVWNDKLVMITCGRTTLVEAAIAALESLRSSQLQAFIYERKNEHFPRMQQTDFFKDARLLNEHMRGRAYQFGSRDTHHLHLYHMDKAYFPASYDSTLEILMYSLQGDAKTYFQNPGHYHAQIKALMEIHPRLGGFQVDDHCFDPCGYSLNAIRGGSYYTVHVTPEDVGSYVSFETNLPLEDDLDDFLSALLGVFQPGSLDVIWFRPDHKIQCIELRGFSMKTSIKQSLSCGYQVSYTSYFKSPVETEEALSLTEYVLE